MSGGASPNYAINFVSGTLTILPAAVTALVTSSANPSLPGATVTFMTALSAVAPGAGIPTGTVQFEVDGAAAGAPVSLSGGMASYKISQTSATARSRLAAEGFRATRISSSTLPIRRPR